MESESPVSLVPKYIGHVNSGELAQIAQITADDIEFTDYEGDIYFESEFMHEYLSDYPEYHIHVHKALRGGTGVAIIGQTSGSHVKPEVEEREVLIWTAQVQEGLITEWRIYKGSK